MQSTVSSAELGSVLFAFFVLAPSIAAAIGYAAWKGKPKRFDREMYWTAFVSAGVLAGVVIVYAMRMQVDIQAWRHYLGLIGLGFGALAFGVALGCGVGIFTYRQTSVPKDLSD